MQFCRGEGRWTCLRRALPGARHVVHLHTLSEMHLIKMVEAQARYANPIDVLGPDLRSAVLESVAEAIDAGAVVAGEPDAKGQFTVVVRRAVTNLQRRAQLLMDFLERGPYEGQEDFVPSEMACKRLSDSETAGAVRFVYYHVVNTFQGALAELLAASEFARFALREFSDGRPRL